MAPNPVTMSSSADVGITEQKSAVLGLSATRIVAPTRQVYPFSPELVEGRTGEQIEELCYATVPSKSPLCDYVLQWAAAEAAQSAAGLHSSTFAKDGDCEECEDTKESLLTQALGKSSKKSVPLLAAGIGWFELTYEGSPLWLLHQEIGSPLATNCGVEICSNVVIFRTKGSGGQSTIRQLIQTLIAARAKQSKGFFKVFRWHVKYQYWQDDVKCLARPVESVVMDDAVKSELISDLDDFQSEATCKFYVDHGIPYKRAYLFHGPPGAGKTSMIQAIAGKYGRSICYLQLVHPEMTDDGLKRAVQKAPTNAIIVLEDIDALFGENRSVQAGKHNGGSLTFSGLLNAIDGVGMPMGQLFIMTTNHRERLDPALIRPGRVDLHIYFGLASYEQMRKMFLNFYPGADAEAESYTTNLKGLGANEISMAALQQFFIRNRKCNASEAASRFTDVVGHVEIGQTSERETTENTTASQATKEEEDAEDTSQETSRGIHIETHANSNTQITITHASK